MFLPNVLSNPAKYWNKYIDLMCTFNFQAVYARSLQSVLVLLAQSLGPFGQTWVFHKLGWFFHKFTENGEFYIEWFHSLRGKNRDACDSPCQTVFKYHEIYARQFWFWLFIHSWSSRTKKCPKINFTANFKIPPMLHFRDMPRICVEKKYRDRIKNGLPCYVSKTKSVHSLFKLMIRTC